MRIGRSVIISAILALSAAGSILAGSAVPSAAAQTSAVHVQAAPLGSSCHVVSRVTHVAYTSKGLPLILLIRGRPLV